jgi:hypothetical protein
VTDCPECKAEVEVIECPDHVGCPKCRVCGYCDLCAWEMQ